MGIIPPQELFLPEKKLYPEVTLIDCHDSFTHNLVQAFTSLGAPVRVVDAHSDINIEIGEYIVLSPGPGTPLEAGRAPEIAGQYLGKVPLLGVCLGMQVINEVTGGTTSSAPEILHGKVSMIAHDGTGVFTGIASPTAVARYHSLQTAGISPRFRIQSMHEGIPMAFHGRNIVAVQFHPESFLTTCGNTMLQNFLELVL